MKGERDEGKKMASLFPELHISNGDKGGGPRAPPRNKMALFDDFSNAPSDTSKIESRSTSVLPVLPTNAYGSFVSQPSSSSNVAGAKRKLRPIFTNMAECPEWQYPQFSNYQNPSSSNSMMKAKCKPLHGFSSYSNCSTHKPGEDNDSVVPSCLLTGKTLYSRNLQLRPCKDKVVAFSPVSSGKHHGACLKLMNETKSEDQANKNLCEGNSIFNKKKSLGDEMSRSADRFAYSQPRSECKILQKSRTVTDGMSTLSEKDTRKGEHSSRVEEDCNERMKIDSIKKCSSDKDFVALTVGIAVKKEETLDAPMEGSILGLNLMTDEVVRVIGQRLFLKARKTMVRQQKIFSLQMFELHRLIMVQRLIARSPEIIHENNFHTSKPPIKFPPMNKLLYVSPLDTSPSVAKTKTDTLKSDPITDCGPESVCGLLPLPTSNVEKGHLSQPLTPKPLPNPAPWCFPPPPGNQWLIPVRSPSEGLVYKPYPGPCFPTVGFMAPVYGNCGPISLGSLGGTPYGVPAPNEQGSGGFYGAELGQSYFQPYPMPLINPTTSDVEIKSMIGVEVDKSSSKVVSDGGKLHVAKESERLESRESSSPDWFERNALSLFPTMPSLSKDQKDEQRVQVIKVVPHNRNSATASAARIFQSIQEERRKNENPVYSHTNCLGFKCFDRRNKLIVQLSCRYLIFSLGSISL